MRTLPDHIIQTLQPAAGMPEYRVLPYSTEKQTETKLKIATAISEGNARIWHLKRLLWHPTQFESCMNYLMQLCEDDFVSTKCLSSFGILTGNTGDCFEVYDKELLKKTYYDDLQDFLADGWVLD